MIAAYRAGIENAVVYGDSPEQGACWSSQTFYQKDSLSYDDKAGQAATAKALEWDKIFQWRLFGVPGCHGPRWYLQKNSPEDLAYL